MKAKNRLDISVALKAAPQLTAIFVVAIALSSCTHQRIVLQDLSQAKLADLKMPDRAAIKTLNSSLKTSLKTSIDQGSTLSKAAFDSSVKFIDKAKEDYAQSQKEMDIWFVKSNQGAMTLVPVHRTQKFCSINMAMRELLDGPSAAESAHGLGSEIPRGTILLGIEEKAEGIELNLSKRFASSGGTSSIETRLEQLSRTVAPIAGKKPVYLNVEGRRLTMTPGEGIEVPQPINM